MQINSIRIMFFKRILILRDIYWNKEIVSLGFGSKSYKGLEAGIMSW